MFKRLNLITASALMLTALAGGSPAYGQQQQQPPPCFSVRSLYGYYAVVATYGANVAIALGKRYFDGNGNLNGTFIVNEPVVGSATGARAIVTGTNVGTYTVNCDGTGSVTRVLTASNGVTTTQMDDFVITRAVIDSSGQFLATALADAVETPSAIVPGGIFVTRTYTRLPQRPPL